MRGARLFQVLRHLMDHEVKILTRPLHQTRSGLLAFRRAVVTLAFVAPVYVYVQIGFVLIAAYLVLFSIAADSRGGWTAWGMAPAMIGMAVVTGPATGRRSRARRAGRRSWVTHVPPRQVVREPESGWWEAHPEPSPTTMTVVVVGESETRWGTQAVVSRLAELALSDELLVVYGSENRVGPGHHDLVAGLRVHLPRHDVVAVRPDQLGVACAARLGQFLENGSLPVVLTPASTTYDAAAELSSRLRADRVLRAHRTIDGVDLHQVWRREVAASAS
jgi:hypothetical protein